MKKVIKNITIQILGYSVFLIALNMLGAFLISKYLESSTYLRTLLLLFSNNSIFVVDFLK